MVRERRPIEPTPLHHPFCEMVLKRRQELGLSGTALTKKLGSFSKGHIAAIERGKTVPSVEYGLAMCQLLNIPMHLCMDYIAEFNLKRMRERMQNEYIEWLSYVPPNVLDDMLQDELSLEVHYTLSKVPEHHEEDIHEDNYEIPPMWAFYKA